MIQKIIDEKIHDHEMENNYTKKINHQIEFADHFVKPFYIQLCCIFPNLKHYLTKI